MIKLKGRIASFFIFNSTFGPKEGEELKRILYYHPAQDPSDARKNQVGLCEAIVKFISTFTSEPCEALHTQTKRHVFYQPEKDYWMVMVIKVPYAPKSAPYTGSESHGDQISTKVMFDLLVTAYKTFKLFLGPFTEIPSDDIYSKCENFFTAHLSESNLKNDVSDVIQGITYLPLDKSSFFKVMCIIDQVEVQYSSLKCVAFLYNDQLMWNCLLPEDILTVYKYLVNTLLPEQVKKEIAGGAVAAAQSHGRFISPSTGIRAPDHLQQVPKIHLTCEHDIHRTEQHYFIVYRALNTTMCFTLRADDHLNLETFRSLDTFIGPQLSTISSYVGEQVAAVQPTAPANDAQFVYFNRLNHAFKSSLDTNKLATSSLVKPEVLNIIADMHADRRSLGSYGEIIIKTTDDFWVTGKTSNEREFYVVIQQKNANLKEISDEVKRVCDAQMKGIFFYPI